MENIQRYLRSVLELLHGGDANDKFAAVCTQLLHFSRTLSPEFHDVLPEMFAEIIVERYRNPEDILIRCVESAPSVEVQWFLVSVVEYLYSKISNRYYTEKFYDDELVGLRNLFFTNLLMSCIQCDAVYHEYLRTSDEGLLMIMMRDVLPKQQELWRYLVRSEMFHEYVVMMIEDARIVDVNKIITEVITITGFNDHYRLVFLDRDLSMKPHVTLTVTYQAMDEYPERLPHHGEFYLFHKLEQAERFVHIAELALRERHTKRSDSL